MRLRPWDQVDLGFNMSRHNLPVHTAARPRPAAGNDNGPMRQRGPDFQLSARANTLTPHPQSRSLPQQPLSTQILSFAAGKDRVEYLLSLGATRWEATKALMQRCVRTALTPIVNQLNVVGIVSIPGMMTGQILGGSDPSVVSTLKQTSAAASSCMI